ncbi:SigB/SigF/SigG family RNA polymerase sigma factor [Actinospica durhamensis]|nr:SigB/SigF/SigG family RNA polymerase sigma factor [Actinospica durhamensis]
MEDQPRIPGPAAPSPDEATSGDRSEQRAEQRAETMRVLRSMAAMPAGDPRRERLRTAVVRDHMPYARHIARRYGRRGVPDEDFEQVAYLGLVKAVDNFDPEHGTGFLGYAAPMIVGEIKRYFRDATWSVHVPRHMQELTGALHRATDALTTEFGREPTIVELGEHLGVDPDEVVEALDAAGAYTTSSLDRPVGYEQESTSLGELIGEVDPGFALTEDREVLRGLVTHLHERDKRILLLRFFRGMTQAEIGEELGLSQMQISRILTRVLCELREGFG